MKEKLLFICLLAVTLGVQAQSRLTGLWVGKLNAGAELQVVFHISSSGADSLTATMDIPDQGLKNIAAGIFKL